METALKWATELFVGLFSKTSPAVQGFVLFGALAAIGALLYMVIAAHFRRRMLKHELRELRAEKSVLETALAREQQKCDDERRVRQEAEQAREKFKEELGAERQRLTESQEKLARQGEDLETASAEVARLEATFARIGDLNHDVWVSETTTAEPPFLSLAQRRTCFAAWLNLKGGVGKTTLTANVAAALATGGAGKPQAMLMLDLDFQGSLSNLFVDRRFFADRIQSRRTVARMLDNDPPAIEELLTPVAGLGGDSRIVVAHEDLEHADFRSQAVFATQGVETRFAFRRLLHRPEVFQRFDFAFFDCPPRLTASSINGLLASDFVVVPSSLHRNDVDAVQRTLKWIEKLSRLNAFRARFVGVVLNRTYYKQGTTEKLTSDERRQLERLNQAVRQFDPTHQAVFANVVCNAPEVVRFSGDNVLFGATPEGHTVFGPVASELLHRMGRNA